MFIAESEFGSPVLMREVVKSAPYSILEIGAGISLPDGMANSTAYVGLNIDLRQHELLSQQAVGRYNRFAAYFDLRRLAGVRDGSERERFDALFEDCRFDMLTMGDVLGENPWKSHYLYSEINPTGNDYLGSSDSLAKLLSLRVGTSLLKQGGKLVITETQTPDEGVAGMLAAEPELLEGYGFENIQYTELAEGALRAPGSFTLTAEKQ